MFYAYLHFSNCLAYLIAHKRKKIVRTANNKYEPNSDVFKAKSSNRKKCMYSSFFLFQWPKMIIRCFGYMGDSRPHSSCQIFISLLVVFSSLI